MLNASYGKTMQTETTEELKFVNTEAEGLAIMQRKLNSVKYMRKMGDKYLLCMYVEANNHKSYVHCGVQVLARSKR